jgi:hypothetical protein
MLRRYSIVQDKLDFERNVDFRDFGRFWTDFRYNAATRPICQVTKSSRLYILFYAAYLAYLFGLLDSGDVEPVKLPIYNFLFNIVDPGRILLIILFLF